MLPRFRNPIRVTLLFLGLAAIATALIGWQQWGCPSPFATCPQGYDWTYQASPMGENYVVFENTTDVTNELAAIQAAHQTWNADPLLFNFTYGGSSSNPAPIRDGVNQIRWGSTGGSLATTTIWLINSSGDIEEADCVFDDSWTWSTAAVTPAGQYDIESVMLHEFGHFLGLDHSNPPAIMQPTIPPATQRRALDTDDQQGAQAIYGATSPGSPKSVVLVAVLLLLAGVLGVLYSRRQRLART